MTNAQLIELLEEHSGAVLVSAEVTHGTFETEIDRFALVQYLRTLAPLGEAMWGDIEQFDDEGGILLLPANTARWTPREDENGDWIEVDRDDIPLSILPFGLR